MKPATWLRLSFAVVLTAAVASCYTLPNAPKKKKTDVTAAAEASAALHEVIYEFVQETLYTYPHLATRAGMHTYTLPKGEEVDLDRELPNYSADLVEARIESLEAFLGRVEKKAPPAALSPNDLADRRLLVAAIRLELLDWKELQIHRRDPLLHARSLAEALYYPLVIGYAPEEERLADVLGRLHWVPAYVERAARVIDSSSEPLAAAAAEVNRFTVALVRTELDARIPKGDGGLRSAYEGMKGPVLEALDGFQRFLDKDLAGKKKVTWRLGKERYEERFAQVFHGAMSPGEARETAERAVGGIGREFFAVARPLYCEENEKDREICGPTKAELVAAAKAEQERIRKEEEQGKKAAEQEKKKKAEEERKRQDEEKKKAEAEKKRQDEEKKKAAEEEKRRQDEEKRKIDEEQAKKKKDIPNPYEDRPKKEEKKSPGGVTNPYGYYRLPGSADAVGAKLAGQDDADAAQKPKAKKDEPKAKKDEPTAAMVERVAAFVFDLLRKPEAGGEGGAIARLETALPAAAESATRRGLLKEGVVEGLSVEESPALLAALGRPLTLVPQPVFQPKLGARLFAVDSDKAGLAYTRTFAVAAALGSPGRFEALRRAVRIEPETRRAIRMLHGDPAWLAGWGLFAAEGLARAGIDGKEESSNPRELLATLAEVLRAAVELSIDVRMHTGDLTEKDAASELVSRAGLERSAAEQRVRWIETAPTDAAAAFLGYRAWSGAAAEIEDRGAFHGRALGLGPVPIVDLAGLLSAADPDAVPDYEGGALAEPEPEGKRRVSVLDAL
jgi:hypothetical protein